MQNSEIRKDYFLDRYVIIAPKRKKRPQKIVRVDDPDALDCTFCPPYVDDPANEKTVYLSKDHNGEWLVRVISNKYPALSLDNPKAYGEQEVIIETPEHNKEIHELSLEHIVEIFNVYINRYKYLSSVKGICHTMVFKNEGGKAGASKPHSHAQVYALPMVPPKLAREAEAIERYTNKHHTCPHCDIIKSEKDGPRVIWEDEHLFVLAPYASDSPYGAWFIPKRHFPTIDQMNESEKMSLAHAFKMILKRLDDIDISYNYFFQNAVDGYDHHMLIKLAPRPNIWAGLELGTGIIINPIPPEDAAKFYQEK
jgi:UDPglucose--hexose-1-phosphate uridylyltransferase